MRTIFLVACVMLGLFPLKVVAQGQLDLDALDNKLSRHLETKMPGWNHERGESMRGSANVLDAAWSSPNKKIKVAILPHNSPEEARAAIREGRKYGCQKEELQGLGDEAYA